MTPRVFLILATFGSAAMLLGAYGFQHLGGFLPCKMCLWQRWPHGAAVLIGLIALKTGNRSVCWLGAIAAATTSYIGFFHQGVEWKWWDGPASCTGGGMDLGALSGADLLSTDAPSGLVMCDEIVWQFLGLSMAGWNGVISAGLVICWLLAARRA